MGTPTTTVTGVSAAPLRTAGTTRRATTATWTLPAGTLGNVTRMRAAFAPALRTGRGLMSDLDRRPQSVTDAQTVDWEAALRYLQLNPKDPRAQALVMVCDRYGLDPLLGHVSLYDGKPYVHFAAYLHIANADPHFDGIECVREWNDRTYYWATGRVHRDDRNFPSERTGKSRKLKPKKGGGSYEDDTADAKAFAQAARRALRMAFNVDAPEPGEDGAEQPAPEPVVEVARMVEEKSGAGEREPAISSEVRDLRHDPAPDRTSGGRGPRGVGGQVAPATGTLAAPSPDPTSDPHPSEARFWRQPDGPVAEGPDPMSDPWGLSPR